MDPTPLPASPLKFCPSQRQSDLECPTGHFLVLSLKSSHFP